MFSSAVDRLNGSSSLDPEDLEDPGESVSTVTRVMVSQNRLYSDSAEVVALQVFSEVIEVEGREVRLLLLLQLHCCCCCSSSSTAAAAPAPLPPDVPPACVSERLLCCLLQVQQPDMCEVKILMSPDFQKLAQFTNVYPMGHSQIFRLPREKDVLVTHPPSPRRGTTSRCLLSLPVRSSRCSPFSIDCSSSSPGLLEAAEEQLVSHTTSQYPLKHSETTQEEVAAPGKLPETPLRMDPDLLYELRYEDDYEDRQPGQSDRIQMETPPKETPSSYSVHWLLLMFC